MQKEKKREIKKEKDPRKQLEGPQREERTISANNHCFVTSYKP